uniref:Glycogenin 1 n=1 Tax=Pan paniscus TaxID=9597 RepID=A0A2R8Z6F4_PANPA
MTDQAFVTLTTNDAYTKGVLALGSSLKQHRTTKRLVILTTPQTVFDEVIMVDRPELGITLTKLHCWLLTQYSKCVFMDADTLVLANIDDLFEREELSAGPDPRWPDCFNSEVFVYQPSLLHLASEQGTSLYTPISQHLKCLLCISWDKSNHGIIYMIPKQKVSKVIPMIPT